MTEIKKPSLIELRKKANKLGIADYAKYSKEELMELIEKKEQEFVTESEVPVPEEAPAEAEQTEQSESTEEAGETPDAAPVTSEETTSSEEESKPAKKQKKEKSVKKEREPRKKKTLIHSLKEGANLDELNEKNKTIVEELLKNDGRSYYKISKDCNTFYSVITRLVEKYLDVKEAD